MIKLQSILSLLLATLMLCEAIEKVQTPEHYVKSIKDIHCEHELAQLDYKCNMASATIDFKGEVFFEMAETFCKHAFERLDEICNNVNDELCKNEYQAREKSCKERFNGVLKFLKFQHKIQDIICQEEFEVFEKKCPPGKVAVLTKIVSSFISDLNKLKLTKLLGSTSKATVKPTVFCKAPLSKLAGSRTKSNVKVAGTSKLRSSSKSNPNVRSSSSRKLCVNRPLPESPSSGKVVPRTKGSSNLKDQTRTKLNDETFLYDLLTKVLLRTLTEVAVQLKTP